MKTLLYLVALVATPALTVAEDSFTTSPNITHRRLLASDDPVVVVDPPQCFIESGFDYLGNDIGNAPGASATDCCSPCFAMEGCNAYSWTSYAGGTCWFKSGRGTIVLNPNAKSALMKFDTTCQQEYNIDYVGNDIANVRAADSFHCCSACIDTPGCRAFTFTSYQGGTCWLKSSKGQMVVDTNAISSTPYLEIPTCGLEYGVDYVGNDIASLPASVPGDCCSICSQFLGCRAFSWTDHNGGTCWLKNRKDGTIKKAGVTSGQTTANPPSPSCALELNVDYVGNDVGRAKSSDAYACCSICMKTDGCHAFSWTNYEGGTCWLKSAKGTTEARAGVKSAQVSNLPIGF
ncbi:hypothetical protein BBJ28_00002518 [Nothophytophthora sp. Chile5]|nr:hypothetical protein BBJ28_00002518 [Nothophytophthora sp. Chile5]